MKKIIHICSIFILASCTKNQNFTYEQWQVGDSVAQKEALTKIPLEVATTTAHYKSKVVNFSRQTINGKPVYNSFFKTVKSAKNLEMIQASTIDEKNISYSENTNHKVENYIDLIKNNKFDKIKIISTENVVKINKNKAIDYTLVSFFDYDGTPYQAHFKNGHVLDEIKRVGSRFSDVNTLVYNKGPKLDNLVEVTLKSVTDRPALTNMTISVTSESDKFIERIMPVLRFDPKDDQFDQVQVFYYLSKSFQWMKEVLKVRIPESLEAVVYMGFPDKTNSAFYFQNKIRIGKGDGVNYSNLAQDSSVVFHESFHALIDGLARLPFEGEGGSINEAFADFFTCLMLDRPYLAESSYLKGAYKRSLINGYKLSEKTGGLYHDSLIISSLLWEIKEKIGFEKAKNLAIETLVKLNTVSTFEDFSIQLQKAATENLNTEDLTAVKSLISNKGFNLL